MSLHTTQYQVIADRSRCCGYGLCAAVCPEIYKLDDDGIVYLTIDRVPPEFRVWGPPGRHLGVPLVVK